MVTATLRRSHGCVTGSTGRKFRNMPTCLPGVTYGDLMAFADRLHLAVYFGAVLGGPEWDIHDQATGTLVATYYPRRGTMFTARVGEAIAGDVWQAFGIAARECPRKRKH
jgi:hypothetical protein